MVVTIEPTGRWTHQIFGLPGYHPWWSQRWRWLRSDGDFGNDLSFFGCETENTGKKVGFWRFEVGEICLTMMMMMMMMMLVLVLVLVLVVLVWWLWWFDHNILGNKNRRNFSFSKSDSLSHMNLSLVSQKRIQCLWWQGKTTDAIRFHCHHLGPLEQKRSRL